MTSKEQNAGIKKLCLRHHKNSALSSRAHKETNHDKANDMANEYWAEHECIKVEAKRLYMADRSMKGLTAKSVLALIRLNTIYHFEPYHLFGLYITI